MLKHKNARPKHQKEVLFKNKKEV